jgi:hypothetical protein
VTITVIDQVVTSGTGTSIAGTPAGNLTNGSFLHVVYKGSTGVCSGVADPTNGSYTPVGTALADASAHKSAQFIVANISSGQPLITASCSSGTSLGLIVREILGASSFDQASSFLNNAVNPGTDAATSGAVTISVAPGLASAVFAGYTGNALSAGTGYTPDTHPLAGWGFVDSLSEHLRYTSPASVAGTATLAAGGSSTVHAHLATFKESASSGQMPKNYYVLP